MGDHDISHYVDERLTALEARVEKLEGDKPGKPDEEEPQPVEEQEDIELYEVEDK